LQQGHGPLNKRIKYFLPGLLLLACEAAAQANFNPVTITPDGTTISASSGTISVVNPVSSGTTEQTLYDTGVSWNATSEFQVNPNYGIGIGLAAGVTPSATLDMAVGSNIIIEMPPPTASYISQSTGGSLASPATYYYVVTEKDLYGAQTMPCTEFSVQLLAGNHEILLNLAATSTGATLCVWRGTSPGGETGYWPTSSVGGITYDTGYGLTTAALPTKGMAGIFRWNPTDGYGRVLNLEGNRTYGSSISFSGGNGYVGENSYNEVFLLNAGGVVMLGEGATYSNSTMHEVINGTNAYTNFGASASVATFPAQLHITDYSASQPIEMLNEASGQSADALDIETSTSTILSKIQANGVVNAPNITGIRAVTTGTTDSAAVTDHLITFNSTASVAETLPAASTWTGQDIRIANLSSSYTVTVMNTVIGSPTTTLSTLGAVETFTSDGTNIWLVH
jgi:hypothetical protein